MHTFKTQFIRLELINAVFWGAAEHIKSMNIIQT